MGCLSWFQDFGFKLNTPASAKSCEKLKPWVKDIKTNFWKLSEMAQGSAEKFKESIMGTLHHLVNEHEWGLGSCNGKA